ncbi:carbohydrate ABC transporter permease [Ruminococcaceae bacterium OttesenSCG-928-D13]|nr:carbohydrate ABC transporter permease [Ruminococcaceae bacterium OttesenSCG-928-D13]
MRLKKSVGRRVFLVVNALLVALISVVCIYPILHILAVSFSSNEAAQGGMVNLLPVDFQLDAYEFVIGNAQFFTSFGVSVKRTLLGLVVNMTITILAAYPLSKTRDKFSGRNKYMWFFVFTMLFSGGLIPGYLIVNATGLIDTIWALVIPSAVPVYNIILLQNYIKGLPGEISESAYIDGAGEWSVLFRIILPLSKPVLATLVLFAAVAHWNSWFDGMIYMNRPQNYPLQTYLQTIVVQLNLKAVTNLSDVTNIAEQNSKAAQIIIAMLPILVVYPFLQKYFTKGIVLGSVKG